MQLQHQNRLAKETSPYLLQHAHNPVDWYAWGEEALERARKEDKPIFLSVGYSACHWCHVMAHESFEDEGVAEKMNSDFINIKVDREERPDIDDIYQRVCQLASGSGGWPLSVFLTPDQKPFYVGTYFPKDGGRYGMPGFLTILTQLSEAYRTKRKDIEAASGEFMQALSQTARDISVSNDAELSRAILDEGAVGLLHMADSIYGGFGQAPKFPNPLNLMFLLRYFDIAGLPKFRDFVIFTCDKMSSGGIFDQLGGGFARYSTDQKWLVPHFEKMLYDNTLLAQLFSEVYQITKDPSHRQVVTSTLDFILREMTDPQGGFYSALDADSEGTEGKFYVWTKGEIAETIADSEKSQIFCDFFGVTEGGNFEGANILNVRSTPASLAKRYGKTEDEIRRIISESSAALLRVREKRVGPSRDEKILVSWNGLAVSGFVKGYMITGNPKYLAAARSAVDHIESRMVQPDGSLFHSIKDGIAKNGGFLDDYAFYIGALLDLFTVDADAKYLELAIKYADYMLKHFGDEKEGTLFFTSDDHERLIVRTKNFYDLAVPSGNSVAALDLLRLFHYSQDEKYIDHATRIMKAGARAAAENPFGFGQLLIAIYLYVNKPVELIITRDGGTSAMEDWVRTAFLPSVLFAIAKPENVAKLRRFPLFAGRTGQGPEIAYVCRNFACSLPILKLEALRKELGAS